MNAIEVRELRKKYGSFEALKGIDLEVHTGEIFGFLGPNGAGKSTTIRILLDEIRATGGTARLLGLDSRRDAVEIHRRLGYLAHRLTESSTAIDALVDQLADDAAGYIRRAIDAGLLTPIPDVAAAARMLTIYSLGSLVLGRHLKRLLDVDIAAEDIAAEPGVTDYVQVQLTLFASLFTPHLLEQLRPQLEEKTKGKEKEE